MPTLEGIEILRAWRHRGEEDRIHYVVATANGGERRLWEPESSEWGQVLDEALLALGYTGPRSAVS